jgi:hypothetical protein
MTTSNKQKTDKIRAERAELGQKRRELSLTDAEFIKVKVFVINLRKQADQSI